MDEVDSARLAPGLPARVTVDSHPGQHFPGRVVRVASYVLDVEEQNRTVEIEVELDERAFAGLARGDAVVVSLDRPEVKAGAPAVVEQDARR